MHLITYQEDRQLTLFYSKRGYLARANTLPYIFRKLRQSRNLTKEALAKKFGISEEYISQIESGSKFPSLNYVIKCGELFGANPYWVKNKWAKEAVDRFSKRILKRLGLDH